MVRTPEEDRVIYAPIDMKAGQEFHNDYGVLSSEQLLINYGYVPEVNADDYYSFDIDLKETAPEAKAVLVKVGVLGTDGKLKTNLKLYEGGISPGVLAIYRVALLSKDELSQVDNILTGKEGSPENEARVAITLKEMCQRRLRLLGNPDRELERLEEIEDLKGVEMVKSRAELAALRYRLHTRKVLTTNEELFHLMEVETAKRLGINIKDEV